MRDFKFVMFLFYFLILFFLFYFYFTGHTEDYSEMISNLAKKYPSTNIVCVGFSLGGNLVTKYMGEKAINRPAMVIGGVSVCQGYNAVE